MARSLRQAGRINGVSAALSGDGFPRCACKARAQPYGRQMTQPRTMNDPWLASVANGRLGGVGGLGRWLGAVAHRHWSVISHFKFGSADMAIKPMF